jgi:hypothetical protein
MVVHQGELSIAPGQTERLRLEVFCIDSHRSSPDNSTVFSLAKNRLPKKLRGKLKSSNQKIYRKHKGDLVKSKSAIQSNMWKTRDAEWIELEGERANEKAPQKRKTPQLNNIYPQQRQLRR